ncbi:MAG TPA: DNA-processing protein DprA [Desulfomonilaceae bacterium]|nr:DNA-processing protein DprA [Desulfomonilaceae bacterium]
MIGDRIPAALFAAAILASGSGLDYRTRLAIISRMSSYSCESVEQAHEALREITRGMSVPLRRVCPASRLRAAAIAAEEWAENKIFVLTRHDLAAAEAYTADLPEALFAFGDRSLIQTRAAAILNSRKPRRTTPHDDWITATRNLVQGALREKFTIVSSYGTIPFSMVSHLAFGMPLIVVCHEELPFMNSAQAEKFRSRYGDLFQWDKTLFISPFPPATRLPPKVRAVERDNMVGALSSALLVAEVRPGGIMDNIVRTAEKKGRKVIRYAGSPETRFAMRTNRQVVIGRSSPCPQPFPLYDEFATKKSRLVHYTRACPGPWPGQTVADYCRTLEEGCTGSSHSGYHTLRRILEERVLRGCARLTRRAHPVVCFTECGPEEVSRLMAWRRGLIRWSFEPYGIAFPTKDLFESGVRPVIYAVEEAFQDLSEDLQHLFQPDCSGRTGWAAEKEWRIRGDLVLTESLRKDMVVLVPSSDEAEAIAREFGCNVALLAHHMGKGWR